MKGREENDQMIERRVQNRLQNAPKIIQKYMVSMSGATASTRNVYLGYILDFYQYLQTQFDIDEKSYDSFKQIKKMDIDGYIEYTKINPKTGKTNGISIRNSKISAVISFFNFLEDNEIIDKNPCAKIKKLKDNKERKVVYLTKEEVEDVKVKISTYSRGWNYDDPWKYRDYAIFLLGCSTGLRNSAIREINLEDLDLKNHEVMVSEKNSVIKTVYFGKNVCDALEKWLEEREKLLAKKKKESQAVFISNHMQRMTDVTLQAVVNKYTKDIDKHITPHKLRSTFATNLYEETGDVKLVADALGHKNIRNTMIYTTASKKKMREAAELMDKIYE